MNPAVLANLRQITLAGMRVAELSREIRHSVAIGDGVAVARNAATLAVLSARILSAVTTSRQEIQREGCPEPERYPIVECPSCWELVPAIGIHFCRDGLANAKGRRVKEVVP